VSKPSISTSIETFGCPVCLLQMLTGRNIHFLYIKGLELKTWTSIALWLRDVVFCNHNSKYKIFLLRCTSGNLTFIILR